jgi:ethanolamine utilization microcompartment shell protein EutL
MRPLNRPTSDVIGYASPAKGTSFSNEVIGFFSGDAGAVRQAILTAREVGVKLLGSLGEAPACLGVPYI